MKKLLIALRLVILIAVFPTLLVAGDPATQTYLVDRYANNAGPGTTMDTLLRLINVGTAGTPLTSPVGDVCANIYVFDNNQEMISCCSCRLTSNELVTASVSNQLTNNPLTSVIPTAGVIKILPTVAGTAVCSATAPSASSDASLVKGFASHLETSGPATFITETNIPVAPLGSNEAGFLSNACFFVKYLGGGYGKGTCSCTGNAVNSGTVTYSISGTISGAGGNGATVNLNGTSTATVTADTSGNFIFTGLGPGSYTVTPSKAGFTFAPASLPATVTTVNSANVTGVNFSTVTYSISGTISGSGGNTATITVSGTANATVTADALGNYTFVNLVNGSYTVTPSKSGFIFTPVNQAVTVSGADTAAVNFTSTGRLAIDQAISTDRSYAASTITSPIFTTTSTNELLLAFISTDARHAGIRVTSVTGGTSMWSLVQRTNTQLGSSEIWSAFTATILSGASVYATLSQSVAASITVVTFSGVDSSGTGGSGAIGATGSNNANPGAPTASLTTTRNNSWVIGVGNDGDTARARTLGPNQTMVHQYLAARGDTFWVQRQTSTTPTAGTVVTINDSAPTGDRYNLSICEVLPAP